MRLDQNDPKEIIIYSKEKWNETGIEIHNGDEYLFEAKGKWNDWFKRTDADGYSNFYMNLYNKLKRSKNNKWFALIGTIDKVDPFLIGTRNQITFDKEGMLYCFANDVPGFYWNNFGHVILTITRLK